MVTGLDLEEAGTSSGQVLGVVSDLATVLPQGGLRRGSTVVLSSGGAGGATALILALLAGPTSQGSWAAVVGMPALGLAAAAELGVDLSHLVLVPEPGRQWAVVTAALLDGLDVVVVSPPARVSADQARRLTARARYKRAVLILAGACPGGGPAGGARPGGGPAGGARPGGGPAGGARPASHWPEGPDLHMAIETSRWLGLGPGHGHLRSRRVEVVVVGRRGASRPERVQLWLPPG